MGGIETGGDAAQFILLGSDTVQVCTGVMKFGYECVKPMCEELLAFMEKHGFETLADFKGKSLDYFTTHAELVRMQADKKAAQKAAVAAEQQKKMVLADGEWSGDTSCSSPTHWRGVTTHQLTLRMPGIESKSVSRLTTGKLCCSASAAIQRS